MNEKKKIEKAAAQYFLDAYNHNLGTHFHILRQQERPDVVVEDGNETLGLEITHLYYGDDEAKLLNGKTDKEVGGVMIFDNLLDNLNALLAEKAAQSLTYDFPHRVMLVIRVASTAFDESDFNDLSDLQIPKNRFAEIWLLPRNSETGSWGILRQLQ